MTRWFYTDPLAAAWMAKSFGMCFWHPELFGGRKIEPHSTIEQLGSDIDSGSWTASDYSDYLLGIQPYIHPDSLHLLEAKPGDVVRVVGRDGRNPTEPISNLYVGKIQHDAIGVVMYPEDIQIIQRNRIAFHWPESEEA
jgi:hypothetical protein